VPSEVLFGVFEVKRESARPSMVYCGDDRSAKRVAAELIRDAASIRWMPVLSASRDTPSHSDCWLPSWHTAAKMARS
jgi:hypothetical protein